MIKLSKDEVRLFNKLQKEFISKKKRLIEIKDVFTKDQRVNDKVRYVVKIKNGKCIDKTRVCISMDEINRNQNKNGKRIVLLLESPHRSEYEINDNRIMPIGPAQGKKKAEAGGGIDEYLNKVFDNMRIIDGKYYIIISNPIQFQTSLGSLHKKGLNKDLRNLIWSNLWNNKEVRQDFIKRLNEYCPNYILNACTLQLTDRVNEELIQNKYKVITYIAYHPAVN